MKGLLRPLFVFALLLLVVVPARAQEDGRDPAGGGTVVTVEGRTVKITVSLDVIMVPEPGVRWSESFRNTVRQGFAAAGDVWNKGFAGTLASGCFDVELDLVLDFIEPGEGSSGQGHDVFISQGFFPRFSSPQLTTETTNDDTAEVFTTNGTAYLPPRMFLPDARGLAHELGHMFGLGDDFTRDAEGNPVTLPGREGTLMEGGDLVDQTLVDRIGDLGRRSGASLPECWQGTANVTSSAVYPDAAHSTCRDGWQLDFAFAASPEGTIDGQGTAELTSGPTCPFPIPAISSTHVDYQVLGEETAGGFSLRFALSGETVDGAFFAGFYSVFGNPASPSGGPPVVVAVSGTSGTGEGMWQFQSEVPPPATYSANGTITIECATCEEAVG
jgi:hypothetical protein